MGLEKDKGCISHNPAGLVCWIGLAVAPSILVATDCPVPGSHATLQAAVDDVACTSISFSAGAHTGSATITRSLLIRGPLSGQATLLGRLDVTAGSVDIVDLVVDGSGTSLGDCAGEVIRARGAARVAGRNLVVVRGAANCGVFSDGFETGTTERWATAAGASSSAGGRPDPSRHLRGVE